MYDKELDEHTRARDWLGKFFSVTHHILLVHRTPLDPSGTPFKILRQVQGVPRWPGSSSLISMLFPSQ